MELTRREMLKLMGAGAGAAALSPVFPGLVGPLTFAAPRSNFDLLVNTDNAIDVLTGTGTRLGQYLPTELDRIRKYPTSERNAGRVLSMADAAADYHSYLPAALLPISKHVFENFDGQRYSTTMTVGTGPGFAPEKYQSPSLQGLFDTPVLKAPGAGPIYIGNYVITGGYKPTGSVGGCISRNMPHANFRINTVSGQQICDFHFAAWWSGNRPCIGIYESVRKRINFCPCTNSIWDAIFWALVAGLAAYAIVTWLIPAIAAAITVPSFALLVAIPGVPPPP